MSNRTADASTPTFSLEWPRAYGGCAGRAEFKREPADFVVEEQLGFEPEGEGEHLFLQIEKQGHNTEWLARQLAKWCEVHPRDVSFSGLKDRQAITTQWFGVQLPGRPDPDLSAFEEPGLRILQARRHPRKLRRGVHRGNRFRIRLRRFEGDADALVAQLQRIAEEGYPNYFGEQRFGFAGGNLGEALRLFRGEIRVRDRARRSIYLSAARSWLFNQLLAERVEAGCWNRYREGDLPGFFGNQSLVRADRVDEDILAKFEQRELCPTGPLWGRGELSTGDGVAEQERQLAARHPDLCSGLEAAGMKQERRRLVARAAGLSWNFEGDELLLSFELESGGYATALLRELVDTE
ncbi:tRNA pseudouridine(13) synthase TruD [Aestuariirhabdus litorea]|uniref:tRNA pseudouridine synthase D n=1 Tax=Aestuariirhabdus litorea TaxID=2528527 RepID=A0A3P3VR38_9GAMM|nr:tRNA pseudouridine(13) synthase TruD [Aestuariirhabdus litorea]RRJ85090.1 tRNA pseudouridine(13) synthase TruD [Aestuariirhabdus litorea]RWW98314.1 tRNA pseudouridine(13) synthase TruD [Endozoicomonadaceae bacterium GTF-13]